MIDFSQSYTYMNKKFKRVFVIVADSVGCGEEPDAAKYGDAGSHTLMHTAEKCGGLNIPVMNSLGLGDLDPILGTSKVSHPHSIVGKAQEASCGKDTLTGHWEMMGVLTKTPFKTFTDTGFPQVLIDELEEKTGHKIIGNIAASGTEIIKQMGEEQMRDNSLIVYTSSDSVLQIAASEEVTGVKELYRCCEIAREICLRPEYLLGRVIARPYVGSTPETFKRTSNRHDLALQPPHKTVMNVLQDNGYMVSCVGKIGDIFNGYGVVKTQKTKNNMHGMEVTISEAKDESFKEGMCFVNLVEFDSEFGHRRNPLGYGNALEEFDVKLGELIKVLRDDDLVIVTADHGNDPTWHGTDHTREKIPLLMYSKSINNGQCLPDRLSFGDIGASVLKAMNIEKPEELIGTPIDELFE